MAPEEARAARSKNRCSALRIGHDQKVRLADLVTPVWVETCSHAYFPVLNANLYPETQQTDHTQLTQRVCY
jgi:hypothetical protein